MKSSNFFLPNLCVRCERKKADESSNIPNPDVAVLGTASKAVGLAWGRTITLKKTTNIFGNLQYVTVFRQMRWLPLQRRDEVLVSPEGLPQLAALLPVPEGNGAAAVARSLGTKKKIS